MAKSKIIYMNKKRDVVTKDQATMFVKQIFDEKGKMVEEHWGILHKDKKVLEK